MINSFKYISYKHLREFFSDFKAVYKAINEEEVLENLAELEEKWGSKYPYSIKIWESNWDVLSPFFKYPPEIRTIIYTKNIIEGFHRQLRKVTKTKIIFPSDLALEKILYLAIQNAINKWTQRYRN